MRRQQSLISRLMNRIEPITESGCWLWTGPVCRAGYGKIGRGRRNEGTAKTHRVAWELFIGAIPKDTNVLHKCDVPCCVNPNHLWLGSHADNVADKIKKGRGRSGSRKGVENKSAKIGPSEVRSIILDRRPQRIIATEYGISRSNVSAIQCGVTWKHLRSTSEATEV